MMHSPQLPALQPSRADAFDQLFVSHFIDAFFGSARPSLPIPNGPSKIWLHELPDFLASPYPSPVQYSIRAASMLSYGTITGDVSIKTDACRWYMRALQSLRHLLSLDDLGSSLYSPESTVCAAVMLIHFETSAGTSPKAWLPHANGAASLLEAQGPERCRDGFMHQIFSHLRLQTVRLFRFIHFLDILCRYADESHSSSRQWRIISFTRLPHRNGRRFRLRVIQS